METNENSTNTSVDLERAHRIANRFVRLAIEAFVADIHDVPYATQAQCGGIGLSDIGEKYREQIWDAIFYGQIPWAKIVNLPQDESLHRSIHEAILSADTPHKIAVVIAPYIPDGITGDDDVPDTCYLYIRSVRASLRVLATYLK